MTQCWTVCVPKLKAQRHAYTHPLENLLLILFSIAHKHIHSGVEMMTINAIEWHTDRVHTCTRRAKMLDERVKFEGESLDRIGYKSIRTIWTSREMLMCHSVATPNSPHNYIRFWWLEIKCTTCDSWNSLAWRVNLSIVVYFQKKKWKNATANR